MDRTETIAYNHLVFRGFPTPVYEPDGNVPPDFLLEGRIAVEVRRLNENERNASFPKGLEESAIPLLTGMQHLTKSFGPATAKAWWLELRFRRPFPPWCSLVSTTRALLEKVRDSGTQTSVSLHIDENIEIDVRRVPGTRGDMFHVATIDDRDSGGWVLEELERNLRSCIYEKTEKVRGYRSRYKEWWLLFVDQLSYGLSDFSRIQFRQQVKIDHGWDRVILVNPLDHTYYFEI
jgi:hypothetical protein